MPRESEVQTFRIVNLKRVIPLENMKRVFEAKRRARRIAFVIVWNADVSRIFDYM